jgi:hypothetical protein
MQILMKRVMCRKIFSEHTPKLNIIVTLLRNRQLYKYVLELEILNFRKVSNKKFLKMSRNI